MQKLTEAIMSSIIDETDASSVVPFLIVGPAEYGDKIRYLTFDRPLNARSAALKQESIVRIATALDLPPEILTGKGDINHWTSWSISQETVQSHLTPLIELICDALTAGYLQPALRNAQFPDWDQYIVWYDASNLSQAPDRSEKAQAVYDRGGLSWEALRREHGFSEHDAPSEEEYNQWVGIQVKDESSARGGPPVAPVTPGSPATHGVATPPGFGDKSKASSGVPMPPKPPPPPAPIIQAPAAPGTPAADAGTENPSAHTVVKNTPPPGSRTKNATVATKTGAQTPKGPPGKE
jgi:hypothetical protein